MYNLDQVPVPSSSSKRRKPPPAVLFALESVRGLVFTEMFLLYRLNAHSYSSEVAVPFFGSPADDIVSLRTFLSTDLRSNALLTHLTLLIPISTLLKHVGTTNNRQLETRHIQWDDWGVVTRKLYNSWLEIPDQNLLSGARFLRHPGAFRHIDVWDLGRARVMQQQTYDLEPVRFVLERAALPRKISGRLDAAIAEDVIVIYESGDRKSRLYLLVF